MSTAASTVAAPVSSAAQSLTRFECRDRFATDNHSRQDGRTITDPRHDVAPTVAQFHRSPGRCETARGRRVAAGRQPSDLSGGVDTTHLHRQGGRTGKAEQRHGDEARDGQSGFDGADAAVTGQTLVVRARLMMLVSAPMIESPVTTL